MAKVLITGGSGLIGAHLLRGLGPENFVYAIARSDRLSAAMQTIEIDLGKPWSTDALPRDVETVVHLAQSDHFRDLPLRAEDVFAVNTQSTAKLLDYARSIGATQFVLASSGGVYGGGSGSLSEDLPIHASGELGFYVGSRICSEIISGCYSSYMNVICLRFFFVYGPGQQPHMLVPRLVESIRSGRAVTLRGETGLRLNPVHVDDAVLAVSKAMTLQGSHTINVAGPAVLSLREMADEIGRVVGRAPQFEVQPAGVMRDLIADTSRMRSLLCTPRISFSQGLEAMMQSGGV